MWSMRRPFGGEGRGYFDRLTELDGAVAADVAAGRNPSTEEFAGRFPEFAEGLASILPFLVAWQRKLRAAAGTVDAPEPGTGPAEASQPPFGLEEN